MIHHTQHIVQTQCQLERMLRSSGMSRGVTKAHSMISQPLQDAACKTLSNTAKTLTESKYQ